jgi:hypothetical protein
MKIFITNKEHKEKKESLNIHTPLWSIKEFAELIDIPWSTIRGYLMHTEKSKKPTEVIKNSSSKNNCKLYKLTDLQQWYKDYVNNT